MIHGSNGLTACLVSMFFVALPAHAGDPEDSMDVNAGSGDIPIVLSPARLRQSLADVPASVTIITQEMMRQYGVESVVEALRLVPGMAVTQVSGNDYRVNYHGGNILVPRQMDVLIDGVSAYRPALARVDWKELPVVLEDIDRIEVTRDPDSASYGSNAMTAVVNIITKSPETVRGTIVERSLGSRGARGLTARQSGTIGDSTHYRVTVDRQRDNGFDVSQGVSNNDATVMNRLNVYSTTKLGTDEAIDLQAAVVQGVKDVAFAEKYQRTLPNQGSRSYYVNATWKKSISASHDVQVQAYASLHQSDQDWTTCPPAAMFLPQLYALWRQNPNYVNAILSGKPPKGGTAQDNALAAEALVAIRAMGSQATTPSCVRTNQDYAERRANIEFQDTHLISDSLRFVNGVRLRQDSGDSQTFLHGKVSNATFSVFSNVEYKPTNWASINVGGYLERDQLTGSEFSPRLALNVHQSPNNTFRFVASKGTRMPDIQEQRANWSYLSTDAVPAVNGSTTLLFFQSALAPGNLKPEHIIAYELGYFGNFPEYGLRVDVKAFDDKLYDLISEKLQAASFFPTNDSSMKQKGFELQVNYEPSNAWSIYGTFARLINGEVTNPLAATQYAPTSRMLGITRNFSNKWNVSLVAYQSNNSGMGQSYYGREDLVLRKTFKSSHNTRLSITLKASNLDNCVSSYYKDVGRMAMSTYSSGKSVSASASLSF